MLVGVVFVVFNYNAVLSVLSSFAIFSLRKRERWLVYCYFNCLHATLGMFCAPSLIGLWHVAI